MNRYMVLEAVAGVLVSDPHTEVPNRYIGQTKKSYEECLKADTFVEMFTPGRAVRKYHQHLVKAVSRGALKQLGEYVYADSPDDALASISSKSKPKPKAKSEKAEPSKERGNE